MGSANLVHRFAHFLDSATSTILTKLYMFWDLESGTWDLGIGNEDLEFGIWDWGLRIWDLGFGT